MNTLMHRLLLLVCMCILAPCAQAYYEPGSGRFLSPDPFGHEASMSLYDYAGGDPVNYLDPDGRLKAAASKGITLGFLNLTRQVPALSDAAVGASLGASAVRDLVAAFTGTDLKLGHLTDPFFTGLESDVNSFMDAQAQADGADTTSATYVYGTATFATGAEAAPAVAGAIGNAAARASGGVVGFLKNLFGGGVKPPPIPATPPPLPSVAAKTIPRGFADAGQFNQATAELEMALAKSGITDAAIGVRGSSVTGVSSRTGKPFGPASDIDIFVESRQLTEGFTTSPNIPGFVHPNKLSGSFDPIAEWSQIWSENLGRKVSVGGFQPGTVPAGPVIRP